MAYEKNRGGLKLLPAQNVDFGGLERITAAANNNPDILKSTCLLRYFEVLSIIQQKYEGSLWLPCESLPITARATFMIAQGTLPT